EHPLGAPHGHVRPAAVEFGGADARRAEVVEFGRPHDRGEVDADALRRDATFPEPGVLHGELAADDAELDRPGHGVEGPAVTLLDELLGAEVADLAGHARWQGARAEAGA